jgi:L,D-transpeptidase catalytic domain
MKQSLRTTVIIISATAAFLHCSAQSVKVTAAINEHNHVLLDITAPKECSNGECIIYRSHADIDRMAVLDMNSMPITKTCLLLCKGHCSFTDSMIAANCTYYYYVKISTEEKKILSGAVQEITVPDILLPVPESKRLSLFIDKINYFLELRFGGIPVKRYPVSFGGLPHNRKLCFDQLSTPEGIYKIEYRRPKATFYKAFGVSYPNALDYTRYQRALTEKKLVAADGTVPSIGGSIQIHGGGVDGNWTWGCIAMRNSDLDELFSLPALTTGCPIYIVGKEVTRETIFRAHPGNL